MEYAVEQSRIEERMKEEGKNSDAFRIHKLSSKASIIVAESKKREKDEK